MKKEIDVSVIIPNLHSPIIDLVAESLFAQHTSLNYEIIIVGMDKFQRIPKNQSLIFLDSGKPISPAEARNRGAGIARGELLIFTDADCIASSNFIENHYRAQKMNPESMIGGSVIFPMKGYLQLCDNVATFHEYMPHIPAGKRKIIPSLNMSILRSAWEKVGGFNQSYPKAAGEDAELAYRVLKSNYSIWFEPNIWITHTHNRNNITELLKHALDFGRYSPRFNPTKKKLGKISWTINATLLLGAPIISFVLVMKALFIEKLPMIYWHTLPIFWLLKIVWCIGASLY